MNKNEIYLSSNIQEKIKNRKNIIFIGNSISDTNMASNHENVFKLGFLDEKIEERLESFKENYDIVRTIILLMMS